MILGTVIPVGRMAVAGVFVTSPLQLGAGTGLRPQGAGRVATEVLPHPTQLIQDKQGLQIIAGIQEDHLPTGKTKTSNDINAENDIILDALIHNTWLTFQIFKMLRNFEDVPKTSPMSKTSLGPGLNRQEKG